MADNTTTQGQCSAAESVTRGRRDQPGTISRRTALKLPAYVALASALPLSLISRPLFAQAPQRGGTLRVAFVGSPVILDPHLARGTEEIVISRSVFDGLILTDNLLQPQPELAESWETSKDASTWTFRLRK